MSAMFVIKFDVQVLWGNVFTCQSNPMDQSDLGDFLTAITNAGHTLVEVCRVEQEEEDDVFFDNEDIIVEEDV